MASRSILVVDDDAPVRALMQVALERAGYSVDCADDGVHASRKIHDRHFEVLITDLLMPDRDGIELIREVKRDFPQIRIIAMSGGGRVNGEQYLQLAKGMGAHALLSKPFLPLDLCNAVEKVCAPPTSS